MILVSKTHFNTRVDEAALAQLSNGVGDSIRKCVQSTFFSYVCKLFFYSRGVVFDGEDTHYLEPIPGLTQTASDPHYLLNHQDFLPQNFTCGECEKKLRRTARSLPAGKKGGELR